MTPKPLISFTVAGHAQPRGSKTSKVIYVKGKPKVDPRTGRIVTVTMDDNPRSKDWMSRVAQAAHDACRRAGLVEVVDAPMVLRTMIQLPRPSSHFTANGNLTLNAPCYPIGTPDLSKMIRGIEDAMQGVVFRNDSRFVDHVNSKRWGPRALVKIEIFTLPKTTREEQAWCQPTLL